MRLDVYAKSTELCTLATRFAYTQYLKTFHSLLRSSPPCHCSKKKNAKLKNYVSVVEREAMKRAKLREIKKSGADMSKFIMTGKLEDEPLFPTYC